LTGAAADIGLRSGIALRNFASATRIFQLGGSYMKLAGTCRRIRLKALQSSPFACLEIDKQWNPLEALNP